MRPASRISIAALCAASRTGATRSWSGGGCDPLAAGPFAGAAACAPFHERRSQPRAPLPAPALRVPGPGRIPTRGGAPHGGRGAPCMGI